MERTRWHAIPTGSTGGAKCRKWAGNQIAICHEYQASGTAEDLGPTDLETERRVFRNLISHSDEDTADITATGGDSQEVTVRR